MLPEPYFSTDNGSLYLGDCLSILPHLGPVDLILTDPPYGLGDITVLAWESGPEITGMSGDCLPNVRFDQGVAFLERVASWPGLWGQIERAVK